MNSLLQTPFIPCGAERLTLSEAFRPGVPNLACGPQHYVVFMKLLLAVATAAIRPETRSELEGLTNEELCRRVGLYLADHASEFDLDDEERPFLQFPEAARSVKKLPPLMLLPGFIGSRNGAWLGRGDPNRPATPEERIRAVLFAAIMPLAGKRVDLEFHLRADQKGKTEPFNAPALEMSGCLHTFLEGRTLADTIRSNLLSAKDLAGTLFTEGLGTAPWEDPTLFYDDVRAPAYAKTLMGRLIPMCRYALLQDDAIALGNGLEPLPLAFIGAADPSVTVRAAKTGKTGWSVLQCGRSESDWLLTALAAGAVSEKGVTEVKLPPPLALLRRLPGARRDPGFVGIRSVGREVARQTGEQYPTFDARSRQFVLAMTSVEGRPELDWLGKTEILRRAESQLLLSLTDMFRARGLSDDSALEQARYRIRRSILPSARSAEAFYRAETLKDCARHYEDFTRVLAGIFAAGCGSSSTRAVQARADARPFFNKILFRDDASSVPSEKE